MSVENLNDGKQPAEFPDGNPKPDNNAASLGPESFIVDPAEISGQRSAAREGGRNNNENAGSDAPKRGRGRPRKPTANSAPTEKAPLDIDGIAAILLSSHAMLAALTKVPEFNLSQAESKTLSTGIVNVARHYDVTATQKTIDWSNLIMCLAMLYGPRLINIGARRRAHKANGATPPADDHVGPVLDMTAAGNKSH